MLQQLVKRKRVVEVFELYLLSASSVENKLHPQDDLSSTPSEVREVLKDFAGVFMMPTGLPPKRILDHHIHLESGSRPVNVQPYRYSYFQKTTIEKLVQEILEQ